MGEGRCVEQEWVLYVSLLCLNSRSLSHAFKPFMAAYLSKSLRCSSQKYGLIGASVVHRRHILLPREESF